MSAGRVLAAVAIVLGLAAPFAGDPPSPPTRISALELASWIREQRPGLRIVDARPAADFTSFSIPTAENVGVDAIASLRLKSNETVVAYVDGRTFVLDGGVDAWLDEVMNPIKSTDVTRYFGGVARPAPPPGAPSQSTTERVRQLRRRGC